MDRRRRRPRALGAALALATGTAVAAGAAPPLKAMRWLAPEADAVAIMTTRPGECYLAPPDPAERLSAEVGRAAFQTPVLLGGQAARAGLACSSCHRSGRGNPDFHFPGVSGAPGTADVTSSLFSSHRGNGVADPRPIPDLGAPKARLKVAQAPEAGALEPFIYGLITQEFDGHAPPPAVLRGLAAYVRAMDPARCAAPARLTATSLLADAQRAVSAAHTLDPASAVIVLASARARLGEIDERYVDQEPLRARLRAADRQLAGAAQAIREGRPSAADLARWRQTAETLARDLARAEPQSLFNPSRLAARAGRRLPP